MRYDTHTHTHTHIYIVRQLRVNHPLPPAFVKKKSIYLCVPGVLVKKFRYLISFIFRQRTVNPAFSCGVGSPDSISRDHMRQRDTDTLAVQAFQQTKIRGGFRELRHSNSLIGCRFVFLYRTVFVLKRDARWAPKSVATRTDRICLCFPECIEVYVSKQRECSVFRLTLYIFCVTFIQK